MAENWYSNDCLCFCIFK